MVSYSAKKIQNKAVINESPTDRMIRELKEENAKLMALIKKSGLGGGHGMSKEATEGNCYIIRSILFDCVTGVFYS